MKTNKPNLGGDLERSITVKGVTVGNLTPGTALASGMSLTDVFEKMLTAYTLPAASLSPPQIFEAGTNLTGTISSSFNKNDAGALTRYVLTKDGVTVVDSPSILGYNLAESLADNVISFVGTFYYSATASVTSGNVSATTSVTSKRRAFYGVDGAVATSADIRAFGSSLMGPENGTTFTISIPAGATSVEFAYPATLRDVTEVRHIESNFDVKEVFSKITLNVAGANGFTPIPYKVYRYVPAAPFTGSAKYEVTI